MYSCGFTFEIEMLTPQHATRWRNRRFYSVAHGYFTHYLDTTFMTVTLAVEKLFE